MSIIALHSSYPPLPSAKSPLLDRLPLEIIDEVASYLAKRDLYSLLLVSHLGYDTFVRTLYWDLDINFCEPEEKPKALGLIEMLATTQRLVLLIKHLRMHLFLNAEGTTQDLLLTIARLFNSIPPNRSPLQSFRFTAWLEDWAETGEKALIYDLADVGPTTMGAFNALRLPCLHTLILDGALPGLSYFFDARPFLAAHPRLTTLDVSSQFLVPDAGTIPLLDRYTGRPRDIMNVCAGGARPVRSLRLYLPSGGNVLVEDDDGTGEAQEMVLHALQETKTLRELQLVPTWPDNTCVEATGRGQGCMPPYLVDQICTSVPNMEKVELYIGHELEETLAVLRRLNYLQEVILHAQREVWDLDRSPSASRSSTPPPRDASTLLSVPSSSTSTSRHSSPGIRSVRGLDDLTDTDVFPLHNTQQPIEQLLLPHCPQLSRVVVEWRGWKRYLEDGEGNADGEGEEEEEAEFADWEQKWEFVVRDDGGREGRWLQVIQ